MITAQPIHFFTHSGVASRTRMVTYLSYAHILRAEAPCSESKTKHAEQLSRDNNK